MDATANSLPPIFTAHLFPELEAKLIELLRSLGPEDWEKQTFAPKWKVKDVAAHLLDTGLRKLSVCRDRYAADTPKIATHADLVALVNRWNQEGVATYRQLSPDQLISLLELASTECSEYYKTLDPFAQAVFPVSWAGEEKSANWFDTAREFTERWHHQQQIRDAVERPGILTREFYSPVLDCFMRALPYTYRTVPSRPGGMAQFNIAGDCGGSWYLCGGGNGWKLAASPCGEKLTETTIPQEIAWRIFTKGMDREAAKAHVRVAGDAQLGLHILSMVSIVG
jgi:uncharacterized protein (TIGR03083 family)